MSRAHRLDRINIRHTIPSNSTKLKWNDSNESSQNLNELPEVLNVNAELLYFITTNSIKNCQLICSSVMCESLEVIKLFYRKVFAYYSTGMIALHQFPSVSKPARVNAKRMLFIQEVNEKWCDSSKEARPIQVRTLWTKVTFMRKRHCITVSTQKESFLRLWWLCRCAVTQFAMRLIFTPTIVSKHLSSSTSVYYPGFNGFVLILIKCDSENKKMPTNCSLLRNAKRIRYENENPVGESCRVFHALIQNLLISKWRLIKFLINFNNRFDTLCSPLH